MRPIVGSMVLIAKVSLAIHGFGQGDGVITVSTQFGPAVVGNLLPNGEGEDEVLEIFNQMRNLGCASGFVPCVSHFGGLSDTGNAVIDAYENGEVDVGHFVGPADGMTDSNTIGLHRDLDDPCQALAIAWHEGQHYVRGGPINTCDHGELYQCTADLMRFLNANCGCSISAAAIASMDAQAENHNEKCNW